VAPLVRGVLATLGFALLAPACGGELVTLGLLPAGEEALVDGPKFGEATLILELASDEASDNPTLTADLLEIYFASARDGTLGEQDVWTARRDSPDEPFAAPEPVLSVNSEEFETSPAISLDGLELWLGAEREGGLGEHDIYVSRRALRGDAWPAPENVRELNSDDKDIPRPPAMGGRVMPLGSQRGDTGYYQTFLATRPSPSEPFAAPVELKEIELEGMNHVDAFLTEDGLDLYLNRTPGAGEDTGDLFVARRATPSAAFGTPVALGSVNTAHDERDPWLSPNGKILYFSSDRAGTLSIYQASLLE
jgi:hypothetical protein